MFVRDEYASMGRASIVAQGRCVVAPIVTDGGASVATASVYLIVCSGMEGPDLELVADIAQGIGSVGLPTIVGGDWQSSPTELHAVGVDRLMAATVIALEGKEFTCATRKGGLVHRLLLGHKPNRRDRGESARR